MNIQPKAGPAVLTPPSATTNSSAAAEAKARAVAMLTGANSAPQQAQTHPVSNPTSISPEEASLVRKSSESVNSGQDHPIESPKEAPAETAESSEPSLSDKYAMLARREKALRAKAQAQEQAIKAREAALVEREAKLSQQQPSSQFDESKYVPRDRLAKDPLSALVEAGLTSDQITELLLNAPKADDLSRDKTVLELKAELKAIRDAQEKAHKASEDRQHQSYQQAINQIRLETKNLVSSDPEFETIKETGSIDDVVDLIKQTFDKDGILLTVEEAAREVESYLIEEATKLTKIKKIQQRLNQSAKPPEAAKPVSQPTGAKTLTNNMGVARQLSARERAILAAKGELKG